MRNFGFADGISKFLSVFLVHCRELLENEAKIEVD